MPSSKNVFLERQELDGAPTELSQPIGSKSLRTIYARAYHLRRYVHAILKYSSDTTEDAKLKTLTPFGMNSQGEQQAE